MSRDLSSARLKRLNTIILLTDGTALSKKELAQRLGCGLRTLERDLGLLRAEFGVDIRNKRGVYKCYSRGMFMAHLRLSKAEATVLAAGLRMGAHFLPHLERESQRMWQQLSRLMPAELMNFGDELSRATTSRCPSPVPTPRS